MDAFGLSAAGKVCLDIGSSHGGFTDCLLQDGAKSIWCVDVGKGLLDYKLRLNPKIHVLESTNIRHMDVGLITEKPELITIDVSFISIEKLFPKLMELAGPHTPIVAMVKPQFEGTPKEVPGGFVKDEDTRQLILSRVRDMMQTGGFTIQAEANSTVKGRQGNLETFFYLMRTV